MTTATYMPILKGKQGELWALREQGYREGICPLIEIPRIGWDYDEEKPAKSIQNHVDSFLRQFEKTLDSIGRCAIDCTLLDGDGTDDSTVALHEILQRSLQLKTPITPTTGLERPSDYNSVVSQFANQNGTGCILRIERDDLHDVLELKATIEQLLGAIRLPPEQVDFVVDLGVLKEDAEHEDIELLMQTLPQIPYTERWRSFWLSGGSFPEFLTDVKANTSEYIPRVEWTIWNNLVRELKIPRAPRFSDYGIAHPISPEVNGRFMNMSASIRYTIDNHWLIVKGRSTRAYGFAQFHDVAARLVGSNDFCGRAFSEGDAYLDDCAGKAAGPGNGSKWRQAGSSHHMLYVAAQVEKAKRLLG